MDERPEAQWARAFLAGCQGMSGFGGSQKRRSDSAGCLVAGSRSARERCRTGQNRALALAAAVPAAKEGAQATRHLVARRGRSSHWGDRALGHPDPGAIAVGVWLEALRG